MFLSAGWHERLKQERERLKASQPVFGQHGGVKKQTQIAYEQGKTSPDLAYLAGIESAGADVQYILTGIRAQPGTGYGPKIGEGSNQYGLPEDQRTLLELFNGLDTEGRRQVLDAAKKAREWRELQREVAELRATQTFHGPVGQAVNGDVHHQGDINVGGLPASSKPGSDKRGRR
jgi:transcriptional regulator with XRE-family HTH domain